MSWEKFDSLSTAEQKAVLQSIFEKTNLMYDITTEKGYNALKKEYSKYSYIHDVVNESMENLS